jgi:hypothetical protein
MPFARAVLVVALVLLYPRGVKASSYPIDLATHAGGELTVTVSPGRYRAVIFHRIPGRDYSVTIVKETSSLPPLAVPSDVTAPVSLQDACAQLKIAFDAIGTPADEAQVGDVARKIDGLLTTSPCQGQTRQEVLAAFALYDNRLESDEYDLALGQQLRVTVRRLSKAGAPERTWTTILTTGDRGEWLTTYGMSFVMLRDEMFFTKAGDQEGEFVITKQREDAISPVKYLPSVLFSWMPASRKNKDLAVSPTAGFGVSNDNFGVLGGVTVTYNTNLGFTAGIAVTRQKRLLGSYTENQIVKENLTEDALHDDVLKPAAFAAVTFRFGSNPFKSAGEEQKSGDGKDDATKVEPATTDKNKGKGK